MEECKRKVIGGDLSPAFLRGYIRSEEVAILDASEKKNFSGGESLQHSLEEFFTDEKISKEEEMKKLSERLCAINPYLAMIR